MIDYLLSYASVLDHVLIASILAMSQAVLLRAGTFSIGPAAFAAIGGYTTGVLTTQYQWNSPLAMALGVMLATVAALLMAFPLSRLRGVFQAVATLALVQVVVTIAMNWDSVTQGVQGISGVPKTATTGWLVLAVAVVMVLMHTLGKYSFGRAMDVIRQDETVAVSLGISVVGHQRLAMTVSGLLAGLAGALQASNSYAVNPEEFGFHMLVQALAMAVLGGQNSLWGPLVGASILTLLPEVSRGFADYRTVVQGALLMLIIIYLPHGIADTLVGKAHDRRVRQAVEARERASGARPVRAQGAAS
jgi:branched-chain amino acid transport system permease protein